MLIAPATSTLADALVESLAALGVRHVFGVSGSNIEHLHDAIHRHPGVLSVLARREDGAAYMADCYARVHRRLGVCCATSGGGMMNLAAGIAESYAESVPVLAIVGQPPTGIHGRGAFQDSSGVAGAVDAELMFRAVSKFVASVRTAGDFWTAITDAASASLSARQGPSVLLVPRDVFEEQVVRLDPDWMRRVEAAAAARPPAAHQLNGLADALRASTRPVALIGAGVRRCVDPTAVVQLLRRLEIPVATTMSGRAEFPNDDPLYLGTCGLAGHPSVHRFIGSEADLIVAVGCRFDAMTRGAIPGVGPGTKVAVVDVEPDPVRRTGVDVVAVVEADAGLTAQRFLESIDLSTIGPWPSPEIQRRRFVPRLAPALPSARPPLRCSGDDLRQSDAVVILESYLPRDGHVVIDAGNCAAAVLHYTDVPRGASSTIALGMGAMGYAIAGGVGAALGSPPTTHTVVCAGDGAFLMLGFEIHVAVDLALPILFVILNNNMHGMCATRQQLYFDSRIEAVGYSPIDIAQVARGFGGPERLWVASAGTAEELRGALREHELHADGPAVLEVRLMVEEVPPFVSLLPDDEPTVPL